MKIVIARYQEDVSWANGVDNCIIYNKSDMPPVTIHPVINLPNVGREGHTYLHHIIENYDKLDDHTVFLQGHPFDHCPHLEYLLKQFKFKIDVQQQMIPFENITQSTLFSNIACCPYDKTLEMIPTFQKVFNLNKTNHPFIFGMGAQFIVSRNTILSRPKSFYENIIKLLEKDAYPIEGFVIERFWNMIFTHSE